MGILDSIKDTMACIMVHSRNFTRYQILTLHRTSNKGVATFHLLYTIVILRHLPGVGLGRQVDLKDNACLLSRGSCSFFCKAVDAKCFLLHKKQNGKRENQKWMKFDQTESQVFRLQSKTKVSMNFMFLSKPKSLTFKTEILERTRDVSCFVVSLEQIRGIKKNSCFFAPPRVSNSVRTFYHETSYRIEKESNRGNVHRPFQKNYSVAKETTKIFHQGSWMGMVNH